MISTKEWRLWMAILIGAVLVIGLSGIGQIEGRFFPVVSPVVLTDPQPLPPPAFQHVWRGEADKLRDCSYRKVHWYYGPRGGADVQVSASFLDRPQIRSTGRLVWDGLIIGLEPDAVLKNSHADVYHQCPGRPWLTVTRYYN